MTDYPDDVMEGVEATNVTPLMTKDEERILEVYDRLEELQLEIAVLRAQGVLGQDDTMNTDEEVFEEHIKKAQQELLEAKAAYQVRTNVIENVLIANPILNAVHAGKNASVMEKDLLPLIRRRDELSIKLNKLSKDVSAARDELVEVGAQNRIISKDNAELAATMLALAEEANSQGKESINDPKFRQQLEELEAEMRTSRQRWRIIKGTASATVAGSGVDWARDPNLLDIVLDKED